MAQSSDKRSSARRGPARKKASARRGTRAGTARGGAKGVARGAAKAAEQAARAGTARSAAAEAAGRGAGVVQGGRVTATATVANTAALGHAGRLLRESGAIVCLFAALIALIALASFDADDPGWSQTGGEGRIANSVGRAGAWFADVALYLLGYMAYLIPLLLLVAGYLLVRDERRARRAYRPFAFVRVVGVALMLASASGLADLHVGVADGALPQGTFGGGILGTAVAWRLVSLLNPLGTTLLLLAMFFCSLTLAFGTSWLQLIETVGAAVLRLAEGSRARLVRGAEARAARARERGSTRAADHDDAPPSWVLRAATEADARASDDPLFGSGGGGGAVAALLGRAREAAAAGADAAREAVGARPRAARPPSASGAASDGRDDRAGAPGLRLGRGRATGTAEAPIDVLLDRPPPDPDGRRPRRDGADAPARGDEPAAAPEPPAEGDADAASVAATAADATPAAGGRSRRKIAIKARAPEPRQASLYVEASDSDLPPIRLLDAPEPQRPGFSARELEALSRLLEEKLAEFRIAVEVVAVHPGPVITRFEMQLAPGIKASRVTSLSQDIARSLSLVSVRVVEVIPGRSTIGIEVPNVHRETVQLSEMLRSRDYVERKSPLTLALGKDISGQPITADLGRMPHLLVAGTTGSGKSVAVNAMLISLLYKATVKDVRLILIDPKMLELNVYDGIPHLLAPVVTDMKEAANALRWCVGEMERRYMVMAELKVRNITGYNRKINEAIAKGAPIVDPLHDATLALEPSAAPPTLEPMPFIVVVVDEFADMMMQVGKKAEELIARIAQKARAAGIHLILATQRPSVDVITGLIKANVPTRIAFQVSSKVDSRTIIDQGGAESLLGHGDMLYQPPGSSLTQRVHGAFVDDHEVVAVVQHIKQSGEPNYIEEILQESQAPIPGLSGGEEGGAEDDPEGDALYDQAVAIVLESRKASISYVQRRLKIGYNRAARMIEQMEEAGVVSRVGANGMREVLAPPPS